MKIKLFKRRAIWVPTWPTCLAIGILTLSLAFLVFSNLHRFLAITQTAGGAEVLVVESWLADDQLEQVASLFSAEGSSYRQIWLTGPPLDRGYLISDTRRSFSDLAAEGLVKLGIPREQIYVVPASGSQRHRTQNAASMLKKEFVESGSGLPARFDVATVGVHARRSRLAFRRVFGRDVEVGIVALQPDDYDPARWYRSSAGLKLTLLEFIAYSTEKLRITSG